MRVASGGRHFACFRIDVRQRHEENTAAGNRLALTELRGDGDVAHRDRAVRRTFHPNGALAVGLQIAWVDFKLLSGRLEHHPACFARRRHYRVADAMCSARGERPHAMRTGVGISGVDVNVLDRHAQRLGANLPRHRFHSLAKVDGRQGDREFAARIGMDQRLARIAAEIHADRIIDGGDAASAMFRHDQRLLVPKTEEKRAAPCVEPAGAGGAGVAGRGVGTGRGAGCCAGAVRAGSGAAGVGRSYATRCGTTGGATLGARVRPAPVSAGASFGADAKAGARVRSTAPPRSGLPPVREDMRRNSSRNGQFAFSAVTCAHSINAQFLAWRRCAFMSPSRYMLSIRNSSGSIPTATAPLSMWHSIAKSTAVTPKPRMAVAGVRLVKTQYTSAWTLGMVYGPGI